MGSLRSVLRPVRHLQRSSRVIMAGANETELREAFKLFDADGDGMISADELETLISKVEDEMVAVISSEFQGDKMEEAKKAIDKLDVDKDGKVSYPEFILAMKYKK